MTPDSSGHFKNFASNLSFHLEADLGMTKEEFIKRQKSQIERLVALEKLFRETVQASSAGERVYQKFVVHICDEQRNILNARPFFRERQTKFTAEISPQLKIRNHKGLYPFHGNFLFVQFVVNAHPWKSTSKVLKIFEEIKAVRKDLVVQNLPLAINRARIFQNSTPPAHLTSMDFIQIAAEGLIAGIDKFCLPYSKGFRHTAIGRMIGNFIENYSATTLHLYPPDKRKLYRANKELRRKDRDNINYEDLAEVLNKDLEVGQKTSASEIADIIAGASTASLDTPATRVGTGAEEGTATILDKYVGREELRPDNRSERYDMLETMIEHAARLSIIHRKVLLMKGVPI